MDVLPLCQGVTCEPQMVVGRSRAFHPMPITTVYTACNVNWIDLVRSFMNTIPKTGMHTFQNRLKWKKESTF